MAGTTPAEVTSRWARRFVMTGAIFLIGFGILDLLEGGRRPLLFLGLLGFVFHTVFGKAYSLLPSYFDRELVTPRFMPVHLALTGGATAALAVASLAGRSWPGGLGATAGAAAWAAGVAVFLATMLWTLRDNLTGGDTGTGDANADRRRVDRAANAAAPIALAYLAVGSYGVLAHYASLPGPFAYFPVVSHVLAAGTATLLVFGVGFRLLPRFLVVRARFGVAAVVVTTGAVGPALLALGLSGETALLHAGAAAQAIAILGFAAAYLDTFYRSDRRRVGLYGVLFGAVAGSLAVLLGLDMALGRGDLSFAPIHFRLNVIGFLGLTIVGVSYQFYPPTAGTFRLASDRTAFAAIALIGGGLLLQSIASMAPAGVTDISESLSLLGGLAVLVGAIVHASLLAGLFRERYG